MTINLNSVHHDGSSRYIHSASLKTIRIGGELVIRLRTGINVPIQHIFLRTCPDGEQLFLEMGPEEVDESSACRWWFVVLRVAMPVTNYRFLLFIDGKAWWFNGAGLSESVPTDVYDFRILADYSAPEWVAGSVFYQIFPDRFADNDPASNVRDGEFEYDGQLSRQRTWGEPQSKWPEAMAEFYGGDLQGIEQHLDYLSDLGVNAIYLNPIFTSLSNHRYDVIDYFNVDKHLGGNSSLISLRTATAKRGIRMLVDHVPNHCGCEHDWFKLAQANAEASTAEYFTFNQHPDDYECWLGVRSLPKLNYRSSRLREVIYAGADSVFRYWLKPPFCLDGWRVDVANMLARHGKDQLENDVWEGIRKAVKEENPQAYLLGENFFDGSSQLQGDKLDATMNYSGFTKPVIYWLSRFSINSHTFASELLEASVPWSTQALVDTWQSFRSSIPWVIARQQFNLLDSHDTARIINKLNGNTDHLHIAITLLLTYVGVPCIYYGDEIGMKGGDSLEARDCMIWDAGQWDFELREFIKKLIQLRRTSPALIDGGFQVLLVDENVIAFLRDTDNSQVIVICNRGDKTYPSGHLLVEHGAIPDGCIFTEYLSGQVSTVLDGALPILTLGPGVQIWVSQ